MQRPNHRVTLEKYLKLDAKSEEPLEYLDGFVVAQAIPAHYHGVICKNVDRKLDPLAESFGCVLKYGDVKVIVKDHEDKEIYRMVPDIAITCDPDDIAGLEANPIKGEAIIHNPWLVIEVLSKKTEKNDREDKRLGYESIKKLTHYVLIDSRKRDMHVFERLPDGRLATPGATDRLIFPHFGNFEMSIDEVYRKTQLHQLKVIRSPSKKGHSPRI